MMNLRWAARWTPWWVLSFGIGFLGSAWLTVGWLALNVMLLVGGGLVIERRRRQPRADPRRIAALELELGFRQPTREDGFEVWSGNVQPSLRNVDPILKQLYEQDWGRKAEEAAKAREN